MADNMMRIAGRGIDGTAKAIKVNSKGNLEVDAKSTTRLFDHKVMPYNVIGFWRDSLIGGSGIDQVMKSTDGGDTWVQLGKTGGGGFRRAILTPSGKLTIFANDNRVWYSSDGGLTFTQVLNAITPSFRAPLYQAVSNKGEMIMVAEYTTDVAHTPFRVFKSIDGGLNWAKVFEKTNAEITHFHSLQYFPEIGKWILTSGDPNDKVFWWESANDGTTWSVIAQGDQSLRTCGIGVRDKNTFVWASDSSYNPCIYTAPISPQIILSDLEQVEQLNGFSLGLTGFGNFFATSSRVEFATDNLISPIHVSVDGGRTWQKEGYLTGKNPFDGHFGSLGADHYGRLYLFFQNTEEYGSVTIQLTPRKDISLPSSIQENPNSDGITLMQKLILPPSTAFQQKVFGKTVGTSESVILPADYSKYPGERLVVIHNNTDVVMEMMTLGFHSSILPNNIIGGGGIPLNFEIPAGDKLFLSKANLPELDYKVPAISFWYRLNSTPTAGLDRPIVYYFGSK